MPEVNPRALYLAPNSNIADSLTRSLLKQNHTESFPSDNILTLAQWLEQTLLSSHSSAVASEMQLLLLWENTIEKMNLGIDMHPPTLAPHALKAWRYMKQWQVPFNELVHAEYGQEIQFNRWCVEFEAQLASSRLVSLEQLAQEKIGESCNIKFESVVLVDFLEPPAPLWGALLQSFSDSVEALSVLSSEGSSFQHQTTSPPQEVQDAANWVSHFLTANPNAKIGVISTHDPGLLDQVEGALWLRGISSNRRTSLRETGVIDAAIRLLKVTLPSIELSDARAIVQSPFHGDHRNELKDRGHWEQRLCALQTRSISRSDFFYCLRESRPMTELREMVRHSPSGLTPIEWADLFDQQLRLVGWPGKRSLGEAQTAAYEAWPDLLGELAELGVMQKSMSCASAIQRLAQLTQQRTIQTDASVQVSLLDRIEAAADLDLLWLFGCDEDHWPGMPVPQPLLPNSIQVKYKMPRCSYEHELTLSTKLLGSLKQRAEQVVCSFSPTSDDQSARFTPLLNSLPELHPAQDTQTWSTRDFEFVDCSRAPALAPGHKEVKGGARLMTLMSASPFDAFAEFRLKARPLDRPFEGVSPAELGQLVHQLLDQFWTELGSKQRLAETGESQLSALVERLVESTLRQWRNTKKTGARQLSLLREQLHQMLLDWIPFELDRDDFSVLSTEEELQLEIGGITLRLRIDRIDETSSGLLLIDYKSGSSGSIEDWRSLPPAEPQLPLYCLASRKNVVAIAFARVKLGDAKWIALGREELVPRLRIEANWDELVGVWKDELTQLAERFAEGDTLIQETSAGFFEDDPLKALHRFNEIEELEPCLTKQ